jgi:hypothetical protein
MATYLPNVTDIIPELRPFTPNFDFYNQILQIKNAQYQQGYKKISNLYDSALNSPLSRDENIQRRDKYFKDIEQEIKKISSLDLSLPQNVAAASDVFKPFYEDKYIQADWVVTKSGMDALTTHKILKNCVGEACEDGQAWDIGKRAVDYKLQEFKNASNEESLNFGKISYTPYIKYADDVLKFMKDNKVEITQETRNGRYNITTTNGPILEGPLYNMIKTLYEGDPNITDMYKTKAYVERNDYIYSRAEQLGSREAAEQEYMIDKTSIITNELDKQLKEVDDQIQILTGRQTNILKHSKLTPQEDQELKSIDQYISLLEKGKSNLQNSKDGFNDLDQVDIKTLRARVDGVMASSLFDNDLRKMAKDFSKIGYSVTSKPDEYALAQYKNAIAFSSSLKLKQYENAAEWEMFQKKKQYEAAIEIEKEKVLAGLGQEADVSVGQTKEGNVQEVNAHSQVNSTVTSMANQYVSTAKGALQEIYQALYTDATSNSPTAKEAQILMNNIFGGVSKNKVQYPNANSQIYTIHQAYYDKALNYLVNSKNYNHLIKPEVRSSIEKTNLYLDAAIKLNVANSNKVGRAMRELDVVDSDMKEYLDYFLDSKVGVNPFNVFLSKSGLDQEEAREIYDELIEVYKEQYSNPEASAAYKTTPFIGGPFVDKTGGMGIRPASVNADPLEYLSDNYSLVSSVIGNVKSAGNFLNADGEANSEAQALFTELSRDFGTRLDRKKENNKRANVTMEYEALSDKPGFAKVTFIPNREWLKENISGKNKEEEAAKMSEYEKGIVAYIPDEKVHNEFDSKIKSLGDAVFESNGNSISIGDNNDVNRGGFIQMNKSDNGYTVTSKTVSWNPSTNQFMFNQPNTTVGYNLNADQLIEDAFRGISISENKINEINMLLTEKNRTITNERIK